MNATTGRPQSAVDLEQLRTALPFSGAKRWRHHLPDIVVLLGLIGLHYNNPAWVGTQVIIALVAINYLVVRRALLHQCSTARQPADDTLALLQDLTRHPELIALADALLVKQGDLRRFQYALLSKAITRQVLDRDRAHLYAEMPHEHDVD